MKKGKYFYRVLQTATNFDDKKELISEASYTTKKSAMKCFNSDKKRIIPSHLAFMFTEVQRIHFDKVKDSFIYETIDFSIKACCEKFRRKRSNRNG